MTRCQRQPTSQRPPCSSTWARTSRRAVGRGTPARCATLLLAAEALGAGVTMAKALHHGVDPVPHSRRTACVAHSCFGPSRPCSSVVAAGARRPRLPRRHWRSCWCRCRYSTAPLGGGQARPRSKGVGGSQACSQARRACTCMQHRLPLDPLPDAAAPTPRFARTPPHPPRAAGAFCAVQRHPLCPRGGPPGLGGPGRLPPLHGPARQRRPRPVGALPGDRKSVV